METDAGVKLNKKEIRLIKKLEKLAKEWGQDGKELRLLSMNGRLHVTLIGGTERNAREDTDSFGSYNRMNIVKSIDGIPNDGGDW